MVDLSGARVQGGGGSRKRGWPGQLAQASWTVMATGMRPGIGRSWTVKGAEKGQSAGAACRRSWGYDWPQSQYRVQTCRRADVQTCTTCLSLLRLPAVCCLSLFESKRSTLPSLRAACAVVHARSPGWSIKGGGVEHRVKLDRVYCMSGGLQPQINDASTWCQATSATM